MTFNRVRGFLPGAAHRLLIFDPQLPPERWPALSGEQEHIAVLFINWMEKHGSCCRGRAQRLAAVPPRPQPEVIARGHLNLLCDNLSRAAEVGPVTF